MNSEEKKSNTGLHVVIGLLVLIIAILLGMFSCQGGLQLGAPSDTEVEEGELIEEEVEEEDVVVIEEVVEEDEGPCWTKQVSFEAGFTIDYPCGWNSTKHPLVSTFTPPEIYYDHLWGIRVYEKDDRSIQDAIGDLIADMGDQWGTDRSEQRQTITLRNNQPALLVTVTTASDPTWVYKAVIVEKGDFIYFISNGATLEYDFDTFYKSFELLDPDQLFS